MTVLGHIPFNDGSQLAGFVEGMAFALEHGGLATRCLTDFFAEHPDLRSSIQRASTLAAELLEQRLDSQDLRHG